MKEVSGGYNTYGFSIGILMLEASFPRIPGDLGNATTFRYPVRYKVVKEAVYQRVVVEGDPKLLEPFIVAARNLEEEGVKAITTTCGFLAIFQKELAAAMTVPVFTSSLMLVPMVYRMLRPNQKVGIVTANASSLKERHFEGAGWSSREIPVVIAGTENEPLFGKMFSEDRQVMDPDQMEADIVRVVKRMVAEDSGIGAIVLECTSMAPYAKAIQAAVGLPIFDIQLLIDMVYASLHRQQYTE